MIVFTTTHKITARTAHVAIGTTANTWAGAVLFESTACGLKITADGMWREVSWSQVTATGWSQTIGVGPGFLLQPCQRCASKLQKLQAADHATALEIDAQRDADRAREVAAEPTYTKTQTVDGYGTPHVVLQRVDASPNMPAWEVELMVGDDQPLPVVQIIRDDRDALVLGVDVPGELTGSPVTGAARERVRAAWGGVITDGMLILVDRVAQRAAHATARDAEWLAADQEPADDVDQEPTVTPDPRGWLLVLDYRDDLDGKPSRHAVVLVGGTDSERWYSPTTGEADQGNGSQGSADTYCGRVAYGVIYGQADGPELTCPECSEVISAGQGTHAEVVTAALEAQAAAEAAELSASEQAADEQRAQQAAFGRVWVPEDAQQPRAWGTFIQVDTLTDRELLRAGAARVALPNGDACWTTAAAAVAPLADADGHARAGAMGDSVLQSAIVEAAHAEALAENSRRVWCSSCAQWVVLADGQHCPACTWDVAADAARVARVDAVTGPELQVLDGILSAYMACNSAGSRLEWEVSTRWVGQFEPTAMGYLSDAGRAAFAQVGFADEAEMLWSEMLDCGESPAYVLRLYRDGRI